jgi:NAD(P)-dependent dehydrogenase (short-subunit alcohol dehydrogenase family)
VDIRGAVALVTGGASGLGLAAVSRLASAGARVVVLDLPTSKGEEVAANLGNGARFAPADVTDSAAVERAVDMASGLGELRILVNCAGIGIAARVVGRDGKPHDLDSFRKVLDVNLVGTFNVVRLAAARMVTNAPNEDGERGVIVNTASIAAFDGQIGQSAYAASKGGIVSLTLVLARDLARDGVRVCTIAPGTFDTPLMALAPEEIKQHLVASIPFPKRFGRPEEYAALVAHIVENPYLNGETIRLDGAVRMPPS